MVRHLLRSHKARVAKRDPFTIRLLIQASSYTQDIALGIDAGTTAKRIKRRSRCSASGYSTRSNIKESNASYSEDAKKEDSS